MQRCTIASLLVHTGKYVEFLDAIVELGRMRLSSYVCVANVHMTIEAYDDPAFAEIVAGADLVTPDGMPLLFALKLLYDVRQERVAGMDLIESILTKAEQENLSVYFYGSDTMTLGHIKEKIKERSPRLMIAGMHSPPFRELTPEERENETEEINRSGAHIVMVALGCPKQEKWMAANKGKVHSVMIGLGGAFPVYAGVKKRAPEWVRRLSLEWLYRLGQEPGRLWRRYFYTNVKFMLLLGMQIIKKPPRE
jgi:N-acetylglucosaminyldiphosphoundecaprenol N-acetyl-beta-D-mannosaminyltransferase